MGSLAALWLLLGAVSGGAQADQPTEAVTTAASNTTGDDFAIVPLPVIGPTFGNGAALVGILTLENLSGLPDGERSTIAAGVAATNNGTVIAGGGGKFYLFDDILRLSLGGFGGKVNLKYYGTSEDSIFFDDPVGFSLSGGGGQTEAQVRVADGVFVGLAARTLQVAMDLQSQIDLFDQLKAHLDSNAVGLTLEFDDVEDGFAPRKGVTARWEYFRYDGVLLSDFDTNTADGYVSGYWPLTGRTVLAGQVRSAYAEDGTPFFLLPFVNIRGFPAGQYLNNYVAQVQGELRWDAWRKLGVVGFGGAAATGDSIAGLSEGDRAWGVGGGLRWIVLDTDRLNVGVDVAYGSSDDVAVYFRIGEAF